MINTLENQLCSLALAKELKSLGVPQKSFFHWVENDAKEQIITNTGHTLWLLPNEYVGECLQADDRVNNYAAFTVAELGSLLPVTITIDLKNTPTYYISLDINDALYIHDKDNDKFRLIQPRLFHLSYKCTRTQNTLKDYVATDEHEANARAKMLIFILKNNFTTINEILTGDFN